MKIAQCPPTLCHPMGSTVHGILQARMLEWVAFPFSRGSSQPRHGTQVSQISGEFFTSWATREAQEYWNGCPSPGDLPDPGIGLGSPALQSYSLPVELSSSVVPFSSCLQFFPASGSFPMSWLFTSGGQSIGISASVLPMNIQGWLPLGLTGLIFLQSKGLSRVFSNTTIWNHQFFGAQLSLWSNSHIWAPKSLQMVIAAMKLKDVYSLEGKLWPT